MGFQLFTLTSVPMLDALLTAALMVGLGYRVRRTIQPELS
jgi:hypothetical protein